MRHLTATTAILLMTATAAQGQTEVTVLVRETAFFGELCLSVEVVPLSEMADGSPGVTLTSQGQLSECTYRNAGMMYEGDPTNALLDGQIDCFGGARLPLGRLEIVSADTRGSMFDPGVPLECRLNVEGTEPRLLRVWECALSWLEDGPQDTLPPGQNWWTPR